MSKKKEPKSLDPDHPVFSKVYGVSFRRSLAVENATPEQKAFWRKNNLALGEELKAEGTTLESWLEDGGTVESAKRFGITE